MSKPQPLGFICALQHHIEKEERREKKEKKRLIFIQNFEVFSEENREITIFSCQQHSFILVALLIYLFYFKKRGERR